MDFSWGDFACKSRKWLKTGWLITAGLVAVYIGAIEPMQLRREFANQESTGLAAVAGGPLMPWRQGETNVATSMEYIGGVVGGVPRASSSKLALALASNAPAPQEPQDASDRKLVRTAAMNLVVKNPGDAVEQARQLAEHAGGFLVSSQVSGTQGNASAELTVRVPVAHFEEIRAAIRKLAIRVESDRIEAEDVTRNYVDRAARLRNLRAQEQQYLAILKRASTVKDTIEVSEKLDEVRGSIEQEQAEFETLSKQIETVAITVSLRSEVEAQVLGLHWRPLYRLKLAFRDGLDGLGDYVAAMASLLFYLPSILLWLATILAGAALAWRILRWAARFFFAFPKLAEKGTN